MNIACPECSTIYRVDPGRVPDGGVTTRCRECGTAFRVESGPGDTTPGEYVVAARAEGRAAGASAAGGPTPPETQPRATRTPEPPTAEAATPEPAPAEAEAAEPEGEGPSGGPVFGPQDPDTRARRLARALVSDIKVYHPDRWEESVQTGSLRIDFRDEIMKSWDEYVEQVGEEMAKKTPYFRDALNEILAQGDRVF